MKIKSLLLDADGLLIKKQRYFSDIYSEQYGIPVESIIPFFKTKFVDCQRGLADLKEELAPFLQQWKWKGTVQDFFDYWFSSGTEIDIEAMEIVSRLREKGFRCYLATDQEKYRGEYIKNNLGFSKYLDGFFYSCDLGKTKSEKEFFEAILDNLILELENIIFCDDEKENIDTAESLGILAFQINNIDDFRNVENFLSEIK
jgi:putative hydrolase of the HAD superfamily